MDQTLDKFFCVNKFGGKKKNMTKELIAEELNSSNSSDDEIAEMEPKPYRSKKIPERFGDAGVLSSSDDDTGDNLSEGSQSDDSYVDDTHKRRVVHTVGQVAKKSKIDSGNVPSQTWMKSYDDEFDQLNRSIEGQLHIDDSVHCENDSNKKDAEEVNSIEISSQINIEMNSPAESKDDKQNDQTSVIEASDASVTPSTNNGNSNADRDLLIEILARVENIEKELMRNALPRYSAAANHDFQDDVTTVKPYDEFHTFLKSNRLPLTNADDMKLFENNLKDAEFKKAAVKVLSSFPGMNRTKGNQPKLLRKIVYFIMDRRFMANFTYSGKSTKGQRKIAFKLQRNIIELLYSIVSKIDKSFDKDDLTLYLKDNILKYASDVLKSKTKTTHSGSSESVASAVSSHENHENEIGDARAKSPTCDGKTSQIDEEINRRNRIEQRLSAHAQAEHHRTNAPMYQNNSDLLMPNERYLFHQQSNKNSLGLDRIPSTANVSHSYEIRNGMNCDVSRLIASQTLHDYTAYDHSSSANDVYGHQNVNQQTTMYQGQRQLNNISRAQKIVVLARQPKIQEKGIFKFMKQ